TPRTSSPSTDPDPNPSRVTKTARPTRPNRQALNQVTRPRTKARALWACASSTPEGPTVCSSRSSAAWPDCSLEADQMAIDTPPRPARTKRPRPAERGAPDETAQADPAATWSTAGAILESRNVTRSYPLGGTIVEALRGVSLAVLPGEFVALMGPSGSGKSTLLQVLGGLDQPTSGEVILEGQTISQLSDDEATRLRRDRTGFVFQSFNLIPLLDATENVALPFTIAGEDPTRGELRERVRDVIGLVDLTGKEHHKPDQLSAGEQQRVAIARALVTRPALLFADEPPDNLDSTTGTEILDALWRSCVGRGQTIVLVTHDSKAAAYADRVHFIGDGQIRDTIELGRRESHDPTPLIARLAKLGL